MPFIIKGINERHFNRNYHLRKPPYMAFKI